MDLKKEPMPEFIFLEDSSFDAFSGEAFSGEDFSGEAFSGEAWACLTGDALAWVILEI